MAGPTVGPWRCSPLGQKPCQSRWNADQRALSGGANVTVNLIQPGTLFGPRRNNFDLRLSKLLRFGPRRLTLSIDGYNLTNSDTVLAYNNSFVPGGAWLTPTRIANPRYMKLGAQFDF